MQYFPATDAPGSPDIAAFHDRATGSWQYVASDPASGAAVIIDPVLDFDPAAGATWTDSADEILGYVSREGLSVAWVLDTHPHADHISAAHYLAQRLESRQGIGRKVLQVQDIWADLYAEDGMRNRPDYWDQLFIDGEGLALGRLQVQVMAAEGHTPASVSYRIGDALFAHDTLMMPDRGTARADFPGGSAEVLWSSLRVILDMPAGTRVFIGHDDGGPESGGPESGGTEKARPVACMATVAQHRAQNVHVRDGIDAATFIAMREARDATLPLPARMLLALQVNLRGGRLPARDARGRAVLRLPLNRFTPRSRD